MYTAGAQMFFPVNLKIDYIYISKERIENGVKQNLKKISFFLNSNINYIILIVNI